MPCCKDMHSIQSSATAMPEAATTSDLDNDRTDITNDSLLNHKKQKGDSAHVAQLFYAVAVGRSPGIYGDWASAQKQVDRYPSNTHKRYETLDEAKEFMKKHNINNPRLVNIKPTSSVTEPCTSLCSASKSNTLLTLSPLTSTATHSTAITSASMRSATSDNNIRRHFTDADDHDIKFNFETGTNSSSTPKLEASPDPSPNKDCTSCKMLVLLVEQLVTRIDTLESKINSLNPCAATNDTLYKLNDRIMNIEDQLKKSYKDVTLSTSTTVNPKIIANQMNSQPVIPARQSHSQANKPSSKNLTAQDRVSQSSSKFRPERCIVVSSTATDKTTFKKLNHDTIRRTLSENHGPLIIDMINRYKFSSDNPRFIIQLSSKNAASTVIDNWRSRTFGGSTVRGTIDPSSMNCVGMVKGVPLDVTDDTIREAINKKYSACTFERLNKNSTPLRTIKLTFPDAEQLSTAINEGLLFESINMLFRVEPPYSTNNNIHS